MRQVTRLLLAICAVASLTQLMAQEELGYADYMHDVMNHHPIARLADLELDIGDGKVLSARGAFDPKVGFGLNAKRFKDQTYYELIDGSIKWATPFGVELGSAYEHNRGDFLNDQNSLPSGGLWNLHIGLPLGQGLFFDQRRAAFQQARLARQASEEKRRLILNKVLADAAKAYWKWFETHLAQDAYREAFRLAQVRRDAITENATIGEAALIDTVEATIQWQNRQLALQEAELAHTIARNELELYLWADGIVPLQLGARTRPPALTDILLPAPVLNPFSDSLLLKHPELRNMQLDVAGLEVESRLRREFLKPILNVNYKPLAAELSELTALNQGDYTLGVEFGIPIFLRKERGKLAMVNAEIRQANLDLAFMNSAVRQDVANAQAEVNMMLNQILTAERVVADYRRLLEGEQALFDNGESSLFLINARETGLLTSQLKVISLYAKCKTAEMFVDFAKGTLYGNF